MSKDTKDTTPKADLVEYSAVGGFDGLDGYIGEIVPNDDPVLASRGGDLKLYAELLRDDQVGSCFQQRRAAVIGKEWRVEPGGKSATDKAAAEFIREQLDRIKWDKKTRMMLAGVFYGYAVAECMWAMEGGQVVLEDIKVRKPYRFMFDKDGGLRLKVSTYPNGKEMPERKFWVFTAGADDDDTPYGLGLGHWLYWPCYLKRNGAKFWAVYLDKYAGGTAVAKYGPGADKKDKDMALAAARALRTMSAVAIPKDFELALLEAVRSAGDDFEKFLSYWDNAIAKIILSQTATTEAGPYVGTADVHGQVRLDVIKADADLVCESFNDSVVRWLVDWNFPSAAYPEVSRVIEDPDQIEATGDRDKSLHDMGYEYTDEELLRRHGEGWRRKAVTAGPDVPPATPADFAEPAPGLPDDVDTLTGQLDGLAMDEMTGLVNALKAVVNDPGITSLEDLSARLLDAVPGMDPSGLAALIRDADTVALLQGMEQAGDAE